MNTRFSLLVLLIFLTSVSTGCHTRYAEYGGIRYEMISEAEEEKLIQDARLAISHISKRLTPQEIRIFENTPPQVKFIYSDHRFGQATVKWDFPRREAGVTFAGEFLSEHMTSMVFTREKQPEILDFTKGRKTISRPQRPHVRSRRK